MNATRRLAYSAGRLTSPVSRPLILAWLHATGREVVVTDAGGVVIRRRAAAPHRRVAVHVIEPRRGGVVGD